jgi:hypothetical protein
MHAGGRLKVLAAVCVEGVDVFPHVAALSCRHVVNASGLSWNAGDMDFTGGQMVLTLKLISMAVSFQDAHSKQKEVRVQCSASNAGLQASSA